MLKKTIYKKVIYSFIFYLCVYPPDLQTEALLRKVGNYLDLLPEMPSFFYRHTDILDIAFRL